MTAWLLSVIGVICLSVLADILLPNGQTNKYIKGIFSVITLYVIISPLPKVISGNFSLENSLNLDAVTFEIDEEFLEHAVSNQFAARETALEKYLDKCGYKATVKYVGKIANGAKIDYINIILDDGALPQAGTHTFTTERIKSLAAEFTGTDMEDIRVLYE